MSEERVPQQGTGTTQARRRMSFPKKLAAFTVVAGLFVTGTVAAPQGASVPQELKAQEASAGAWDCVSVAKNAFQVVAGSPATKFAAFLRALRSANGCGTSVASYICSSSHKWHGGWARTLIRWATGGHYSRC